MAQTIQNKELIFVDANVPLEMTLAGRPKAKAAQKFLESNNTIISPLTAHLFVYFGQKDGISTSDLLEGLKCFKITDFGQLEVSWAISNIQNNDFEDALQVACAISSGAQAFVTLDSKLAKAYRSFIKMIIL